jgi:pyrimidine-nucleoside phosphorylase
MTDPRDVVAKKRDGDTLTEDELRTVVLGYARGDVSDELAAAFLMASFIRGLDREETVALTRSMVESGRTLSLDGVSRPTVDKHSTGGVADGVTLVFAPLAASLGLAVAKLSGRGLGHTGGTLDKLESIPGLRTDLDPETFRRQVDRIGCAIAAQTEDLVPADGALYALRDATATVPSVPLIAASVMSKKLAVETDLILLDVKAGSGAFMKTPEGAAALAQACVDLAAGWGRRCRAAVTDMSQPLGEAVGNSLDIVEAVEVLRGDRGGRMTDLAVEFAAAAQAALLDLPDDEGGRRAREALSSGRAADAFRDLVQAQGGDPRVVDEPGEILPRAPVIVPLPTERSGFLRTVDAEAIGRASVALGAGRTRKGEPIDPAVGIVFRPKVGDRVEAEEPIGEVHARSEKLAAAVVRAVNDAMDLSDRPVDPPRLVHATRDTGDR